MGYSHCTGPRPEMGPETGPGPVSSNKLCRSVHTAPRPAQGPGPIVSYCVIPIPCAGPGPFPRAM